MTKRTRLFLAILVIIALVLVGVFAWLFKTGKIKIGAETVVSGATLTGTVVDADTGAKLAGKKIVLRGYDKFKDASDADYENNALYGNICIGGDSKDIVDQYEAKSDKDGKFTITDKEMLPGKYFIDFCSTGNPNYQEITDRNQTIDLLAGTTEIKIQYPKTVKIEVTADKNGNYNIAQAPPGKYTIASSGSNKTGDIEIKQGQKTAFDFISATTTTTTTTKPSPNTTTTTATKPIVTTTTTAPLGPKITSLNKNIKMLLPGIYSICMNWQATGDYNMSLGQVLNFHIKIDGADKGWKTSRDGIQYCDWGYGKDHTVSIQVQDSKGRLSSEVTK